MAADFLDLSEKLSDYDFAKVVVLPIPFEQTVTYGRGTRKGPAAIIEASTQVEFYDREFASEPVDKFGIHTLPALDFSESSEGAAAQIYKEALRHIKSGKFIVGLGGEHSVSVGLVRAQADISNEPLTIVQIDAHCDLRDSYEGSKNNHACVARRFLEIANVERIVQLGVRSISTEEAEFIRKNGGRVKTFFAEDVEKNYWREKFTSLISGKKVYLTIDVDGFDPSVIPATGTPEPGGLSWQKTLEIIRATASNAEIISFDCVELAPVNGLHASEYAAAKLVYKVLAIKYNRLEVGKWESGKVGRSKGRITNNE